MNPDQNNTAPNQNAPAEPLAGTEPVVQQNAPAESLAGNNPVIQQTTPVESSNNPTTESMATADVSMPVEQAAPQAQTVAPVPQKKPMGIIFIALIVVVLAVIGAFFLLG